MFKEESIQEPEPEKLALEFAQIHKLPMKS